jgi:hypothetical protein
MVAKVYLLSVVLKPPWAHLNLVLAVGEVVAGDGEGAVMRVDEPNEERLREVLGDAHVVEDL